MTIKIFWDYCAAKPRQEISATNATCKIEQGVAFFCIYGFYGGISNFVRIEILTLWLVTMSQQFAVKVNLKVSIGGFRSFYVRQWATGCRNKKYGFFSEIKLNSGHFFSSEHVFAFVKEVFDTRQNLKKRRWFKPVLTCNIYRQLLFYSVGVNKTIFRDRSVRKSVRFTPKTQWKGNTWVSDLLDGLRERRFSLASDNWQCSKKRWILPGGYSPTEAI